MCHSCARPLCLRCAVPARGEVFGPECLPEVLGPSGATAPRVVPPRTRDVPFAVIGLALAGAVVGSVLPWSRFGDPSGIFGGWGIEPQRWSSLATYAAVAGLAVWFVASFRRWERAWWIRALFVVVGAAVVAGCILHVIDPPPFTHAWLGPWVTLGFGIVCLGAAAIALLRTSGTERPNRPDP
jgi:hypothetical protein